jgi:hypothetical protein
VSLVLPGGATGCYTTDGSTPAAATAGTCSPGSTAYSKPIVVSSSETIQAIATEVGYLNSSVASAGYTIQNNCPQNQSIGSFTLCGETYTVITKGTSVSAAANYTPIAGNAVIAWATWCFTESCTSSTAGVTATIGDNINATESCFTASPHSPFTTDGNGGAQGSGDFQGFYVWYCPSVPAGVTTFTVTPSVSTLYYLQLHISEWAAGSLATSCSPVTACFESVDNSSVAGNTTGGATATITTSGPTTSSDDLIFAITQIPCCSFTSSAGAGYTGITVAPASNPGMVVEAKAASGVGIQTATSTWTGGSAAWFGVIAPIKAIAAPP